jgi:uncharacterized protein (TIGR00290 family)
LGIPVVFRSAAWKDYETVFISALREFDKSGIRTAVFGDIDVESHLEWIKRVCALADLTPWLPLWKRDRRQLLEEFISLGFQATIVVTRNDKLDQSFLGKVIDGETITEMERAGIDVAGELGEYHTMVTGGPVFASEIPIRIEGKSYHDGCWILRVESDEPLAELTPRGRLGTPANADESPEKRVSVVLGRANRDRSSVSEESCRWLG